MSVEENKTDLILNLTYINYKFYCVSYMSGIAVEVRKRT